METLLIDVKNDFTPVPGPRFREQGEFSGEQFREDVLEPILRDRPDAVVVIDLDGPRAYIGSFLEEVFGGIIRSMGVDVYDRVQPRAIRYPHRYSRAVTLMDEEVVRQQAMGAGR